MSKLQKVFRILGCFLILCSMGFVLFSQLHAKKAQADAAQITEKICAILPPRSAGLMEVYSCAEMPVLQIGGQDFSGLVDIPAFGLTLPIYNTWDSGKTTSYPCRFWGTVYDGSLVIGGADQPGQFDFLDKIELGCVIKVVDMTGGEYVYTVTRVDRSKTAQSDVLIDEGSDLTLFARDAYSLDYLMVRCAAGNLP